LDKRRLGGDTAGPGRDWKRGGQEMVKCKGKLRAQKKFETKKKPERMKRRALGTGAKSKKIPTLPWGGKRNNRRRKGRTSNRKR